MPASQALGQQGATSVNAQQVDSVGRWFLRVPEQAEEAVATQLQAVFAQHAGSNSVLIVYERDDRKVVLPREKWLDDSAETESALKGILGGNNVVFQRTKG
jgi:hypothetical protein